MNNNVVDINLYRRKKENKNKFPLDLMTIVELSQKHKKINKFLQEFYHLFGEEEYNKLADLHNEIIDLKEINLKKYKKLN